MAVLQLRVSRQKCRMPELSYKALKALQRQNFFTHLAKGRQRPSKEIYRTLGSIDDCCDIAEWAFFPTFSKAAPLL